MIFSSSVVALYRDCFDGFKGVESLRSDYVGCRLQKWNGKALPWCLCDTTQCNGNSSLALRSLGDVYDNQKPSYNNDNDDTNRPHYGGNDDRFDDDVSGSDYRGNENDNHVQKQTARQSPVLSTHAEYTVYEQYSSTHAPMATTYRTNTQPPRQYFSRNKGIIFIFFIIEVIVFDYTSMK